MKRNSQKQWQCLVHVNGHALTLSVSGYTAATAARRAIAEALRNPVNYRKRFETLSVAVCKSALLPTALEAFTANTVGVTK